MLDQPQQIQCHPCAHASDIAVMKERDKRTQDTLDEIVPCLKDILRELNRITLVEHQILSHREDIERLYKSINEMLKEHGVIEKRVNSWDDKIKAGWFVFGCAMLIVTGMAKYIAGGIHEKYDSLYNSVTNLSMSVDSFEKKLDRFTYGKTLSK